MEIALDRRMIIDLVFDEFLKMPMHCQAFTKSELSRIHFHKDMIKEIMSEHLKDDLLDIHLYALNNIYEDLMSQPESESLLSIAAKRNVFYSFAYAIRKSLYVIYAIDDADKKEQQKLLQETGKMALHESLYNHSDLERAALNELFHKSAISKKDVLYDLYVDRAQQSANDFVERASAVTREKVYRAALRKTDSYKDLGQAEAEELFLNILYGITSSDTQESRGEMRDKIDAILNRLKK